LEGLEVEEGSWVSEKPPQEPVRVSYCFARKKGWRYLLRRTKSALNRDASYALGEKDLRGALLTKFFSRSLCAYNDETPTQVKLL
jgi:hypothetical protein